MSSISGNQTCYVGNLESQPHNLTDSQTVDETQLTSMEKKQTNCVGSDLINTSLSIPSSNHPCISTTSLGTDDFLKKPKKLSYQMKLVICTAGIIVCFFIFGIITEKINECHGVIVDGKCESGKFEFAIVLSMVLSLCYWIFARGFLILKPHLAKDETCIGFYILCGLLNVFGVVASTKALESVSYPTQVIAKSAKPVPIIILCRLFGIKTYPAYKYLFVLLICVGVGLAVDKTGKLAGLLDPGGKLTNLKTDNSHTKGLLLLLFSLLMDGILAVLEEKMCATTAPSAIKMMASLNGWSVIYLAAALLLPDEAQRFYIFVTKYPTVFYYLGGLAVCGTTGQVFVYLMISTFGTLPCAIATTVRKVFSTVYSALQHDRHLFSSQNWIGVALVFGAFFGDLVYQQKSTPKNL